MASGRCCVLLEWAPVTFTLDLMAPTERPNEADPIKALLLFCGAAFVFVGGMMAVMAIESLIDRGPHSSAHFDPLYLLILSLLPLGGGVAVLRSARKRTRGDGNDET
jgi:hypothetical protein